MPRCYAIIFSWKMIGLLCTDIHVHTVPIKKTQGYQFKFDMIEQESYCYGETGKGGITWINLYKIKLSHIYATKPSESFHSHYSTLIHPSYRTTAKPVWARYLRVTPLTDCRVDSNASSFRNNTYHRADLPALLVLTQIFIFSNLTCTLLECGFCFYSEDSLSICSGFLEHLLSILADER